jgi:hypothetical protein
MPSATCFERSINIVHRSKEFKGCRIGIAGSLRRRNDETHG